jgi:hypothetical protein
MAALRPAQTKFAFPVRLTPGTNKVIPNIFFTRHSGILDRCSARSGLLTFAEKPMGKFIDWQSRVNGAHIDYQAIYP